MTKIQLHDTMSDVVSKLSEGNIGAITVIANIFKNATRIDPGCALDYLGPLCILDEAGIYGPHIWILYKDKCESNINKFLALLRANQLGFLSTDKLVNLSMERISDINNGEDLSIYYNKVKEQLPNFVLEE